ncbi:monooxygenase [Archangium lipolyticum]|uniref:monooxygenase n=1 Tax=Archangium lipolyticum TaxID=2970465 RepID=UPI00214A5CAC|nr:hypothetical protein [Archangium lipolyticum]
MRRVIGAGALLVAAAVLSSCDEPKDPTPQPVPATWHKNVGPLIQQKCGSCHVEGGIAPFALQTYAQAQAQRDAIKASVQSGHMPPWPPSRECAQYLDDRSLGSEEVALITRWADEGGPEGNPADAPRNPRPQPGGGLSRVDATLSMPVEYTPQQSPDDYRCFLIDWPYGDQRYVTGFRANPGNASIVHHVIAYLAEPNQVAAAQALDDNEPGPGYTCFGGPGLNGGQMAWLGSWAPGSLGMDYPAGTGMRVAAGSKVILQVHYNTGHGLHGGQAGPDRTSVSMKVDTAVDKVAFVQPWANIDWVLKKTMNIPAGQADVVHAWGADPTSVLDQLTGGVFEKGKPITVHNVALHMHTLGTRTRMEIRRGAGGSECLLDIPRWDFHWQGSYALTQSKVVNPGDSIHLECHWDNSTPGAREVNWGEGTGDEMCLGLFYMTQ